MPQIQVIEPLARPQVQKLRVAAYCRVSSDSDDQRNSFSIQVEHYTQLIQSHPDWEFVDIYADEGITGTRTDKRDDFQRLMADCRAGKIDRVLVKSLSRFARNSKDCLEAVRELRSLHVNVYFEKENIDTGHMTSELYFTMHAAFSQEESGSISKNMRRGAAMRMRNGTFRLSQAPYGYRLDDSGDLLVCPEESRIVAEIFQGYLSGKSVREIAADLAYRQVPKLRGQPVWSPTGVSYILSNERYMGDERFQKRFTTDEFPYRKVKNRGEKSQFYAEATHEAIVSPSLFQKAQELREKKRLLHQPGPSDTTYPFTKVLVCGKCGSTLCRRVRKGGGVSWVCYRHLRNSDQCPLRPLQETSVENAFLTLYNKLGKNRDEILGNFLAQVERLQEREAARHPEILRLHQEMAGLLQENHALAELRKQECIDAAFYIAQTNENNKKLEAHRQALGRYRSFCDTHPLLKKSIQLFHRLEQTPALSGFDSDVFHHMVEKVTVTGDSLLFHLRNGMEFSESRAAR